MHDTPLAARLSAPLSQYLINALSADPFQAPCMNRNQRQARLVHTRIRIMDRLSFFGLMGFVSKPKTIKKPCFLQRFYCMYDRKNEKIGKSSFLGWQNRESCRWRARAGPVSWSSKRLSWDFRL